MCEVIMDYINVFVVSPPIGMHYWQLTDYIEPGVYELEISISHSLVFNIANLWSL